MKFQREAFNDSVLTAYYSGEAKQSAQGANVIMEERVAEARRKDLENRGSRQRTHEHAISHYVKNTVYVGANAVASTFLPANANARCTLPAGQTMLRVEHLDRYLEPAKMSADQLIAAFESWNRRSDAVPDLVQHFINEMNGDVRDGRPVFATFLEDVAPVADRATWPKDLCQVLGLGHYEGSKDAPLLLAQMRYGTDGVGTGDHACAAPTVLDSHPSPHFHPSPRPGSSMGSGYALDLGGTGATVREILHRRIVYRPEHLYAVKLLDSSIAVGDKTLMDFRIRHLDSLRRMTGGSSFGKDLPDAPR